MKILIVEDEQHVKDVIRASLESHHIIYFEASSVLEAKCYLRQHQMDIILLDLELDKGATLIPFAHEQQQPMPRIIVMTVMSKLKNLRQRFQQVNTSFKLVELNEIIFKK